METYPSPNLAGNHHPCKLTEDNSANGLSPAIYNETDLARAKFPLGIVKILTVTMKDKIRTKQGSAEQRRAS
jgi:hypothetical protein